MARAPRLPPLPRKSKHAPQILRPQTPGGGGTHTHPNSLNTATNTNHKQDFYAYEPDINSAGVPQDVLAALAETFRNGSYARDTAAGAAAPPLPVKMFMLDAYWMWNVRSNGNCKMNDTAWPLPFPRGLAALSQAVGPLILYNGPQCSTSSPMPCRWSSRHSPR